MVQWVVRWDDYIMKSIRDILPQLGRMFTRVRQYFACCLMLAINGLVLVMYYPKDLNITSFVLLWVAFARLFDVFFAYNTRWLRWGFYMSFMETATMVDIWVLDTTPTKYSLLHTYHILFIATCIARNAIGETKQVLRNTPSVKLETPPIGDVEQVNIQPITIAFVT